MAFEPIQFSLINCILTLLKTVVVLCLSITACWGQQNLFNVPSSDVTIQGKPFFQQQFNFSKDLVQLNSTFCYGLPWHSEVGINVIGLNLNTGPRPPLIIANGDKNNSPVYPFFTFNVQKAITLSALFKLAVGTQSGFSKGGHFGTYTYSNLVTALTQTHSKIITGIYYGSKSFLGPGQRNTLIESIDPVGFQAGIEQQLIKERLLLIAENISGTHGLGETTLGAAYYLTEHWVLSVGYQFANKLSQTTNSVVVEFTYVPSSVVHQKIYKHGHHRNTNK